jgi:hypothetical protein
VIVRPPRFWLVGAEAESEQHVFTLAEELGSVAAAFGRWESPSLFLLLREAEALRDAVMQ